jgi:hypothetical protein
MLHDLLKGRRILLRRHLLYEGLEGGGLAQTHRASGKKDGTGGVMRLL